MRAHSAFRLGYADLVVLALHEEVAPVGPELVAVNTGAPCGQRSHVDQLVKINVQLGKISERQCGAAYPGRAACVHIRVEHRLAGESCMEIPVLVEMSLERSITGCCVYDAVTAEGDLERHGVRPGSSLKTLGHEETGLRI